jgi:anti-sigma-K factor RskA
VAGYNSTQLPTQIPEAPNLGSYATALQSSSFDLWAVVFVALAGVAPATRAQSAESMILGMLTSLTAVVVVVVPCHLAARFVTGGYGSLRGMLRLQGLSAVALWLWAIPGGTNGLSLGLLAHQAAVLCVSLMACHGVSWGAAVTTVFWVGFPAFAFGLLELSYFSKMFDYWLYK